ncbi:uncharacterized protein LOC120334857 isoform X1 [Styela clava]
MFLVYVGSDVCRSYYQMSKSRQLARAESEIDSLRQSSDSMRRGYEREVAEMKIENSVMKDKMERLNELSAENLMLASDAADLQGELCELREEARDLRNRCHELTEDNRGLKMEVRDLRRHIDAISKNRNVDPRQELIEKIDYYQSEHDRLLEEIRSLKQRLGDVTPRSPRARSPCLRSSSPQRSSSPHRSCSPRRSSPSRSQHSSSSKGVRFSDTQPERTAAGDALAAVTATMHAAERVMRDKNMSPSVALNLRDLTMDRYQKHMEGESPRSLDSDSTEFLLKPSCSENGSKNITSSSCARQLMVDDEDDDVEFNESSKPRIVNGTTRSSEIDILNWLKKHGSPGRSRDCSRRSGGGRITPTSRSRSTSPPLGAAGYRSISPRTRAQRSVSPCNRGQRSCSPRNMSSQTKSSKCSTEYPPEISRSLPRRAFAPRNPSDLKLGYAIKFTRPGGKVSRGNVKYVGHLPGRSEVFVGVESDNFDGKHCGTFQGSKYFSCPPNKGIFAPFSKIIMAWE